MSRFAQIFLQADAAFAGYASLLLLLLPATQIYYCATLDAVIGTLLLWSVILYAGSKRRDTIVAIAAFLAATFLTFGAAWGLPVLLYLDVRRGTWKRFALLIAVLIAGYTAFYVLTGYNQLAALQTASRLENPAGVRPLVEPRDYLLTRIENIAEIAAFFGPFLLLLAKRGLPILCKKYKQAFGLGLAAVGTLLGLFATGAYHTGETARACLFIWPYLLLPVLALLQQSPETERRTLLYLVFAQTLAMQMFGNWFW